MPPPVVIFGTGGLGRETAWLAQEAGREIAGFLDDDVAMHHADVGGYLVLDSASALPEKAEVIVAIGSPRDRFSVAARLAAAGIQFATLVHPAAQLGPRVTIGQGTQVPAGCIITCDVSLGDHCVLGIGSRVSHNCVLEKFCTLAPGVTLPGNTHMHSGAEVAIGATMRQQLTLGEGSMLGMGGVLTRDLAPNKLAMGLPATEVRELQRWEGNEG